MVALLLLVGLVYTVGTRFVQVRKFGAMFKTLFGSTKKVDKNQISSFNAFCVALSERVGTGNIVGVATAIAVGGPGSVFWMWVVAIIGAASAFAESTLAQMYKFRKGKFWRGGPFSYIADGLKCRWLAVVYAVVMVVSVGIFFTSVQANSMTGAVLNAFEFDKFWVGVVLAVFMTAVVLGGVRRISKVTSVITPFMAVAYIAVTLAVLVVNRHGIPAAFRSIIEGAFTFNSATGGFLGAAVIMGVKRGLFSNEAGQGTGAVPSASAEVDHPVQQGLAQSFSVYIDTLLICTATALMIITTGCYNVVDYYTGEVLVENFPELGNNYVMYAQAAADTLFSGFGQYFISLSLIFFAVTTLMAYFFHIDTCVVFLTKDKKPVWGKVAGAAVRVVFILSVLMGSVYEAEFAWMLADIGAGSLAWVNLVALLLLCPQVFRSLKDYEKR